MILEPVNSSGVLTVTATAVVCSTNCLVTDIILNPGSAGSVVNIYDPAAQGVQTTTSATLVMKLIGAANAGSVVSNQARPLELKNGCLVEVTGTAATAVVNFSKIGG